MFAEIVTDYVLQYAYSLKADRFKKGITVHELNLMMVVLNYRYEKNFNKKFLSDFIASPYGEVFHLEPLLERYSAFNTSFLPLPEPLGKIDLHLDEKEMKFIKNEIENIVKVDHFDLIKDLYKMKK